MELHEIILGVAVCVPGLFLTIGSYVLQRDRYWTRVWKKMGEPQIESVEELKLLIEEQHQTVRGKGAQSKTSSASIV
jgi:hypothetical protein